MSAGLAYDGAPRAITEQEAVAIAEGEYGYHRSERSWVLTHRGADGGMHYTEQAYSKGAARGATEELRRALVRRIMAGACQHTVFYDRARDHFYCA